MPLTRLGEAEADVVLDARSYPRAETGMSCSRMRETMANFPNDLAGLVFDYEYTGGNDPEDTTGSGSDGDPTLVADPPPSLVPDVIVFPEDGGPEDGGPEDGGGCNLFDLDNFTVLVQLARSPSRVFRA